MAKFDVTYIVTISRTYHCEMVGTEHNITEKAQERLEKIIEEGKKLPGDMEDEEVDVEIDSVEEV